MAKFITTMGGFDVEIHMRGKNRIFGHISKEHGFFLDPTTVQDFLEVTPNDLVQIAKKSAEIGLFGITPPGCTDCGGTPFFPNLIPQEQGELPSRRCTRVFHHSLPAL